MNWTLFDSVRISALAAVMLLAMLGSTTAHAARVSQCSARLIVELTPDVPDPHDAEFLSSLLSNHTNYQLTWVRRAGPFEVVLDLIGPGSDDQCRDVIRTMDHDGRVLSIRPDSEELQSVFVTAESVPSKFGPDLRIFGGGLGALVWAARHRGEAWDIVLPALPVDPAGAYADLSGSCRITLLSTGESHPCA
jgi:hypothetical protein